MTANMAEKISAVYYFGNYEVCSDTTMLVSNLGRNISARFLSRTLATHTPLPEKDCKSVTPPYDQLIRNLEQIRRQLGNRPLTFAEKALYSHLHDPQNIGTAGITRGETYLLLSPERVAMQDASAQCVVTPLAGDVADLHK